MAADGEELGRAQLRVADHLPDGHPHELAQQSVVDVVKRVAHVLERDRVERDLGIGMVVIVREDEIRGGRSGRNCDAGARR